MVLTRLELEEQTQRKKSVRRYPMGLARVTLRDGRTYGKSFPSREDAIRAYPDYKEIKWMRREVD